MVLGNRLLVAPGCGVAAMAGGAVPALYSAARRRRLCCRPSGLTSGRMSMHLYRRKLHTQSSTSRRGSRGSSPNEPACHVRVVVAPSNLEQCAGTTCRPVLHVGLSTMGRRPAPIRSTGRMGRRRLYVAVVKSDVECDFGASALQHRVPARPGGSPGRSVGARQPCRYRRRRGAGDSHPAEAAWGVADRVIYPTTEAFASHAGPAAVALSSRTGRGAGVPRFAPLLACADCAKSWPCLPEPLTFSAAMIWSVTRHPAFARFAWARPLTCHRSTDWTRRRCCRDQARGLFPRATDSPVTHEVSTANST